MHTLETVIARDVTSFFLRRWIVFGLTKRYTRGFMQIGFIGLGNMGAPMARNLAAAGHQVRGYDISDVAVEGVMPTHSIAGVSEGADLVISMLPNGDILRRVYDELVPTVARGSCLLDCSTVDVESARDVQRQATEAQLMCLDAPVSGGVSGAEAGTLTFMVGGATEAFTFAVPVFDIMGQKAVHCGAGGSGQAAKICNNMLLAISMIGSCEAFNLADKLGLDRQKLFDVVSTSSGYCWSMNAYCPAPGVGPQSPADNNYKPGFAASLMLKDLGLSQQAAQQVKAETPLGAHALALYNNMVDDGQGDRDFSAILLHLGKL